MPFLWGRLSHGYETFVSIEKRFAGNPTDVFRRFYLDTVVYEPDILAYGVRWVAVERVVFGTDYPFFGDQSLQHCLHTVSAYAALSATEKHSILTETPARLCGINQVFRGERSTP